MIAELLTILAVAAATVVVIFTLSLFRDWVKNNIGNMRNKDILSGFVRDRMQSGDYKVVTFLYDQKEKEIKKRHVFETPLFDEELEMKLGNKDVYLDGE